MKNKKLKNKIKQSIYKPQKSKVNIFFEKTSEINKEVNDFAKNIFGKKITKNLSKHKKN